MLAKINGLFRLTKDMSLAYTPSGTAIGKLNLACSEKYKDTESQLFLDAVIFGKPAEIINQYSGTKGSQLFLSGKLETQSWEKDGQKQYKNSMTVDSFEFIGNKADNQGQTQAKREPQVVYEQSNIPNIDIDEDLTEIPF